MIRHGKRRPSCDAAVEEGLRLLLTDGVPLCWPVYQWNAEFVTIYFRWEKRHVEFGKTRCVLSLLNRQRQAVSRLDHLSPHVRLLSAMAFLRDLIPVVAFLLLCSLGEPSEADDTGEGEELVKEILYKPEECERVTKAHDMLSMHYTGTLTETGVKFDSR